MSNIFTTISIPAQLGVLINSYLSEPVIGGINPGQGIMGAAQQALLNVASDITTNYYAGGVRIEPTSYRTEYTAEISEQLLVNVQGGKQYLADSIAPHPRVWRIAGYIPGDSVTDILGAVSAIAGTMGGQAGIVIWATLGLATTMTEITNLFMPSLTAKQKYLESLFYSRQTFNFKTRTNEVIKNAVMSELMIERTPEAQNKLGVQVVIREINVLTSISSSNVTQACTALGGQNYNTDPISCGATSSSAVSQPPYYSGNYRTASP